MCIIARNNTLMIVTAQYRHSEQYTLLFYYLSTSEIDIYIHSIIRST